VGWFDGEFRYGVAPLPSLAALDPNANVIHLGTMSKVLDPGLRMTYLRLPPHLLDTVVDTRRALGSTVAAPIQKAVTELIETDELAGTLPACASSTPTAGKPCSARSPTCRPSSTSAETRPPPHRR
jgi:DNA-binding transcriptional MocR family regulator